LYKPKSTFNDLSNISKSESSIEIDIFPDVIEEDFQNEQSAGLVSRNSDRYKLPHCKYKSNQFSVPKLSLQNTQSLQNLIEL